MTIIINTKYALGDSMQVISGEWKGKRFKVKDISLLWNYPDGEQFIKYSGLIKRGAAWSFYESQVEKIDCDFTGLTWDVKEGDVILLDSKEWTITNIDIDVETGHAYMGSPIETYGSTTTLKLKCSGEERNYILEDDIPVKVVGHKEKTFV